jgi:chemotaxis protein methyltransferase CheR
MSLEHFAFERVQRLIYSHAGIVLETGKEYLVEARLAPIARNCGLARVDDLIAQLDTKPDLAIQVVEAMTTNETSFFRDYRPFELIRKELIPELIRKREDRRTLNIWCAACSSGQEPYSIAMLVRDNFPQLASWSVRIFATDISSVILERARGARFSQLEVNRGLGAAQLVKHFQRVGLQWELKSDLKDMVSFAQLNLTASWPILPIFDLVFLRNVMIYFDMETKRKVLAKLCERVAQDGYIFLGGGESTLNIETKLERVEFESAGCYRIASPSPNRAQLP